MLGVRLCSRGTVMTRWADLISVCGAVGGAVISSGACCTVGLVRQVL